jgi:type IV secretion system protein VirD4
MSYIVTLAAKHNYKISIFAPGRDYSCVINPLDFIKDENDDATAVVLAEVFHSNLSQGMDKGDAFFGPAGQRLIQALFQFAKSTPYPDMAMAFSVLQLPQLVARLHHAAENDTLGYFVRAAFSQLISTLDSEKTSASIISTASNLVNRFISPRLLPSMLGTTNVPLILGEKEIVVFQSDIFRQDAINPMLAAVINIVMQNNFSIQRQVPIVFSADEFPTLYLPKAPTWANEHRSKGYVGIYGYQSIPQLVEAYGQEKSQILLAGLGTQFWFNPNHYATAKSFENSLGEREIWINTKNWSRNPGQSGRGRALQEQVHLRSLITAEEFNHFRQGECLLLNPGYESRQQTSLPWHISRIAISSQDREREQKCERIWDKRLRDQIIQREQGNRPQLDLEKQLKLRQQLAERLLPLPPETGLKRKGIVEPIIKPDF